MQNALILSAGYYTAAAAGTGVATPMAGDTFNVPNFDFSAPAWLENVWSTGASTDFVSIHSPRMHDNNQGIRLYTGAGNDDPLMPFGTNQTLYPADTPTVSIDETAIATGGVATLYGFQSLPGVAARLDSWANVQPRINSISGVQVNVGAVGAIGQYSPGVAINSAFDNFQAGSDYALLGYLVKTSVLALVVSGQDTGNVKVGGPGVNDPKVTRDWFIKLSNDSGRPYIPIIAANNKGSTLVAQTDSSAAAAQSVTLIMAQLN